MNIGNFRLARPTRGDISIMTIEVDDDISRELLQKLRQLDNVRHVVYLHANE